MKGRANGVLYLLLAGWITVSMSYYVLGVVALREEFFHSSLYAAEPFEFKDDLETIRDVSDLKRKLGLEDGSILRSINGRPYTGWMQMLKIVRLAKPGDLMRVGVRTPRGLEKQFEFPLLPREGPGFSVGGYILLLLPILGVPLLGLLVGYWVVAGRPRDLNAWLVLLLLSFPETGFGNLDWRFWTGWIFPILGVFNLLVQHMVFIGLLWFGIFFPERWRFDVRWPWLKWLLLAITLGTLCAETTQIFAQFYEIRRAAGMKATLNRVDILTGWIAALCVVLFLLALIDKLLTSSTADAKRRVRVLTIGSVLSLGPLTVIFGVLPRFGIDPHHGDWFQVVVPFVALFPLTLAYVLIVQRAMDVRVLLRMGTKYLLAKATIVGMEIALCAGVIFGLILPMMQKKNYPVLNIVLLLLAVAALIRVFAMRDSLSNRAQRWLDRKFFREAYNSELVLSELSEQARQFVDRDPLVETISRRVSEILHVPQIGVMLRASSAYHLQQAVGLDLRIPVLLQEESITVRNLTRTNRPATVYADRPEAWFQEAGEAEKKALRQVNAELLLPLPGRERLMGLMTLGPKLSQEPYTPTDLRVLQFLAIQTGLALEITELVQSLAKEATQRERINREIEIAREVQQRLFPQKLPEVPGLEFAGMCRAALGVGGDYYDLIQFENGKLGVAIGDVSGKGIAAALLMAGLRASLRAMMTIDGSDDLAKTMQRINRLVYEASAINRYATFFFAILDPVTREMHYVNAGHNPPMLIRGDSREVIRLEAGGTVVGLLPEVSYQSGAVTMGSGDILVCFTDGISEAMDMAEEEWSEERMLEAVRKVPGATADEVLSEVFRTADEFTGEAAQHDDMTLLIVRVTDVADSSGSPTPFATLGSKSLDAATS